MQHSNIIRFPVERTKRNCELFAIEELTEDLVYGNFDILDEIGFDLDSDDENTINQMTLCYESIKSFIYYLEGYYHPLQELCNDIFTDDYSLDDDPQLSFNFEK